MPLSSCNQVKVVRAIESKINMLIDESEAINFPFVWVYKSSIDSSSKLSTSKSNYLNFLTILLKN